MKKREIERRFKEAASREIKIMQFADAHNVMPTEFKKWALETGLSENEAADLATRYVMYLTTQ
jgi:hypothetical protein